MPTILITCRQCGREFAPDHQAIVAATWRTCTACQPPRSEETRCPKCGRVLRTGTRTLCAACLGVSL